MTMNGHTTIQGYPDMVDPEFSRPRASNASEIRTEASKEQQHASKSRSKRKRYVFLVGLVVLFYLIPILLSNISRPVTAQDYTFGSENVIKGSTANPANKNTEDGSYEQLIEGDQYADTNFSGSSENIVTGTAAGGSFPTALDTDDSTRRNYVEASTAPSAYNIFLVPTSDVQAQWDVVYPASPTTHFDKLDDPGTVSLGDSDSTYVNTATVTDVDIFGMSDMSDPGTGYSLTVTIYLVHKKTATQTCNIQGGIRIGTTNYQGISVNPTNGVYTNTSSTAWTTNPAGGAWTYTAVNALNTYIASSDISPVPYATKIVLKIAVSYAANYNLDA